jgi:DNA repair protein RecO (recombination protein O)
MPPEYETEAVVLRGVRYGEADTVLALLTLTHGRLGAIAKGARRPRSRLGGRLQPGVRLRVALARGRGDLDTVRGAHVVEANAGLWSHGYRLRAAGCVLEAALRVLPEREESPAAYHLLARALALLAAAPAGPSPPRLDPLVLGVQAKLLVASGLLPRLDACAVCGAPPPLPRLSARMGCALCAICETPGAEDVGAHALGALAGLVSRPLREAPQAVPPAAAPGVERAVGLVFAEHLGVTLRSAAPLSHLRHDDP